MVVVLRGVLSVPVLPIQASKYCRRCAWGLPASVCCGGDVAVVVLWQRIAREMERRLGEDELGTAWQPRAVTTTSLARILTLLGL